MTQRLTKRLHLDRLPPGVREALDSWRFWFTVLAVAIAGLVLWGIVNTAEISSTQARQARDDAVKAAQIQAQAQSTYTSCVSARPELAKISRFVRGVNDLAGVLVANAQAIINATPSGDPERDTRIGNFGRIYRAASKIGAIRSLPVPTLADCQARRASVIDQAHP